MTTGTALSAIGIVVASAAFPQTPPGEFEVASIRSNTANDRIVTINVGPGGRFSARGYTLVLLMQRAYGVMDWNVSGGPAWIREERWDVAAKVKTASLTEAQLRPMLQKMLAERFNLKLHEGTQEMSGYALMVGRRGPKLKVVPDGEQHEDSFRMSAGGLVAKGIKMGDFARFVGGKLGLVVVDKTGLDGVYEVNIRWPEETDLSPGIDPREAYRSVVFAALEDQLGLKLAAQKVAARMLVIDNVNKASPN